MGQCGISPPTMRGPLCGLAFDALVFPLVGLVSSPSASASGEHRRWNAVTPGGRTDIAMASRSHGVLGGIGSHFGSRRAGGGGGIVPGAAVAARRAFFGVAGGPLGVAGGVVNVLFRSLGWPCESSL